MLKYDNGLQEEINEVRIKIDKLQNFIDSYDELYRMGWSSSHIDIRQVELIRYQLHCLSLYKDILIGRHSLLTDKNDLVGLI